MSIFVSTPDCFPAFADRRARLASRVALSLLAAAALSASGDTA